MESNLNRETDRLPEDVKAAIMSTFVTGNGSGELWDSLEKLTDMIYRELEEFRIPVSREMLYAYYKDLR